MSEYELNVAAIKAELLASRAREDRREIYLMVAKEHTRTLLTRADGHTEDIFYIDPEKMLEVRLEAEAIYQGMIKFCGEGE